MEYIFGEWHRESQKLEFHFESLLFDGLDDRLLSFNSNYCANYTHQPMAEARDLGRFFPFPFIRKVFEGNLKPCNYQRDEKKTVFCICHVNES
jgi:hypothetical protein